MEQNFFKKYKLIFIAAALVLFFAFGANLVKLSFKRVVLVVWGTNLTKSDFENYAGGDSMRMGKYNIVFKYEEKKPGEYEEALLNSFISNESPDIFLFNNTQLGQFKKLIYPLDLNSRQYNIVNVQKDFPTIVEKEVVIDNRLYMSPLSIDTLALYYNRNIFDSLSIPTGPKNWTELQSMVPMLRKIDGQNRIERSAIGMGDSASIKNSADILSLLIYQLNGKIINDSQNRAVINDSVFLSNQSIDPGTTALTFYSTFYQPTSQNYSWNRSFGNDIDAFAQSKLAMFIGYYSDKELIQKKSPNLSFGISEMPQSIHNPGVNFGKILGFSVSRQSKNQDLAWEVLNYLNNDNNWKNLFADKKIPPARRSLISSLSSDVELGVFAKQSLNAKNYYNPDWKRTLSLFLEAIDSANNSKNYKEASSRLSQNLTNLLRNH